jgi:hypothetical protein
VTFKKRFSQYIITEFTPPSVFFFLTPPIPGVSVETVLIFPFAYMCTEYSYHIHFPYTLSLYSPTFHWYLPLDRTYFAFLFSIFEKNDIFVCLRYLYSVFHCDISVYICIITQIGSSRLFFLLYTLVPLCWFQQV